MGHRYGRQFVCFLRAMSRHSCYFCPQAPAHLSTFYTLKDKERETPEKTNNWLTLQPCFSSCTDTSGYLTTFVLPFCLPKTSAGYNCEHMYIFLEEELNFSVSRVKSGFAGFEKLFRRSLCRFLTWKYNLSNQVQLQINNDHARCHPAPIIHTRAFMCLPVFGPVTSGGHGSLCSATFSTQKFIGPL